MIERSTLLKMLRPAGGGVHVVSTGVQETQALQARIYRASSVDDIHEKWCGAIDSLHASKACLLGVPSDTGAGFTRGANRAPAALRAHLLKTPSHPVWHSDLVDIGDVYTVPQLLSAEMISDAQKIRTEKALYGHDHGLKNPPISPLDICRAALEFAYAEQPNIRPIVLGGDHSIGWPAFAAAYQHWEKTLGRRIGLLHFDAHTDLLKDRLGIQYCFATWAYHANELLGRDGRLVQVGIRASGHTRAHWETSLGVKQYWAQDAEAMGVDDLAEDIRVRFRQLGVDALYVSNDIDGTDPQFAAATGTPEPHGLTPGLVSGLTRRLAAEFPLVGGDLVEVAPPLAGEVNGEPERTLDTAGRYLGDLCQLACAD